MDNSYLESLPKKQAAILNTAEDLFMRFGIRRISIEEICREASVSKMTFYKYYKNKVKLVKHLYTEWHRQAYEKFHQIREKDISFEEKLSQILKLKEQSVAKISKQFALEYYNSYPELNVFFQELYIRGMNYFVDFLKEAQLKGQVRKDLQPEFFLAVVDKIKELIEDETLAELYPTYKDFVLEINNFMFYGLLPRPGKEK